MKATFFILLVTGLLAIGCNENSGNEAGAVAPPPAAAPDKTVGVPSTNPYDNPDLEALDVSDKHKKVSITCNGNKGYKECSLPNWVTGKILDIQIKKNLSETECVLDTNFGIREDRKVWVDSGCKARFLLGTSSYQVKIGAKGKWKRGDIKAYSSDYIKPCIVPETTEPEVLVTDKTYGLGVKGGKVVPDQINHDPETDEYQQVQIDFKTSVKAARVVLSRLFKNEGSGERAKWIVYDEDGNVLKEGIVDKLNYKFRKNQHEVVVDINVEKGECFKYMVIGPLPYEDPSRRPTDSSDFYIKKLKVSL